jgi:N-acetylmuramoyl-L-alanine amidase
MRKIDLIVIHCSASREDKDYTFEQLLKDHKARGFRTCGYHFFIRKDGIRHIGRPIEEIGAHVGDVGKNSNSIGICYEGGLDKKLKAKDTRTEEQKAEILATILEILTKLKAIQPDVKIKIVGHRDLSPDLDGDGVVEPKEWVKMCPCFDATTEYKHVKV